MKSTGRRTTTARATSNVKNCVAFRPTQVHRAEKIGNHRSLRDAAGLCNCVHVPLYSTSPPIIIGGPFSFLKDSSATVFQGILKRRKDQRKISIRCGPCARHVSDPTPDLFFLEGWEGARPICTRPVCG